MTARKLIRWLPVLLWMAVIFWLSGQADLPHHPEQWVDVVLKKGGHMAEYGILAGLVCWARPSTGDGVSRRVFLFALAVSGAYAISDEVHQFFVPGRNGQPLDVAFDLLGTLVALFWISRFLASRPAGRLH